MIDKKRGTGKFCKNIVGYIITLICIVLIVKQINLKDVLDAVEHFQWLYLLIGVVSLAIGYTARIFRWSFMLRSAKAMTTWKQCVAPFLGSITLNNVLPLRLGDVVRILIFPASMGISRTDATSSVVMERCIDLMTLLGALVVGVSLAPGTHLPLPLAHLATVLALVGGIAILGVFLFSGRLSQLFASWSQTSSGRFGQYLLVAGQLLRGLAAMSRPAPLFTVLVISVFVWGGESGLFYCILLGDGLTPSPAIGVIVMAIATLSTLIPSSPGYVGPFHLAAFTAITMLGGNTAQAGSYAILSHLGVWLPTTIAGAVAIWMQPALFRTARVNAQEQNDATEVSHG